MPTKKFNVVWLKLALQDMHNIATYIASTDPEAATQVVQSIWDNAQSLSFFPDRAVRGRVPGTRELMHASLPYFIAFRVKANTVQILRVIHTSRNYPQN
ncbi:type II toxin-antitoxin system RelE/ParE family toxin [Desulfovibrio sp. OttesenSCG-928-F07]|nr:type II toxin-antitoxin system RelE/ParE family toxin [Desulfovibrio sp. OttesenSCG-928-F07]